MPLCEMVRALKEQSRRYSTKEGCLQAKAGVLAVCAAQQVGWCDDDVQTTRMISEYLALKHFELQHGYINQDDHLELESLVNQATMEQIKLARLSMCMILNLDTGHEVNEQFIEILRRCYEKMG